MKTIKNIGLKLAVIMAVFMAVPAVDIMIKNE